MRNMDNSIITRLSAIGMALSGEKNIDALLNLIVDEAKGITEADAGTLYLVDPDKQTLIFSIMHNDTQDVHAHYQHEIKLAPVPLYLPDGTPNHTNVSSHVALSGDHINIPDVYEDKDFDFSGPRKYDQVTGYRSQSMLVIPMQDHHGDILGVIQLINAMDTATNEVCPFTPEEAGIVGSLASQAAVALNNVRLIQQLEDLLQAFIKTIASAIDAKSKYTGSHIRRVAQLTMDIAEAVNACETPPFDTVHFNESQMKELSLAAWLHDVGKIVTPQHIIDKRSKLETVIDRAELVKTRFQLIETSIRLTAAQSRMKALEQGASQQTLHALDTALDAEVQQIQSELAFVLSCNRSMEFMPDEKIDKIKAIGKKTYVWQGQEYPYLTQDEQDNLCIQKGNLTLAERKAIEDHAQATWDLLSQLPFPPDLANVATYAAQHHEKLDGSGYTQGLTAKDIPLQSRILAIADIFEALSAADRPYKDPLPISRVLQIMDFMQQDGHLDPDILELFIGNKVFMKFVNKEVSPAQNDVG
ncbi:MAG: metal-dependent phosphohydrolase [Deltaproteobacteria bacterium]|nr:MAG: metal-dependent phosphohydrolase [Deltaproteobacteria bacterium]